MQDAWNEFWRSLVVISAAMVLLRLAGRKSISQMTIPTTVIMISIGTVIVQPIADKSIWMALIAAVTFILVLMLVEFLHIKWDWFGSMLSGAATMVIKDGEVQMQQLKKLRLPLDQLEMKLRQSGISSVGDVKSATIETNGQLGYELSEEAKPVTAGRLKALLAEMAEAQKQQEPEKSEKPKQLKEPSLFAASMLDGKTGDNAG
ncbi:DUF421 domain-containing protein [Paenibacillus sp. S150]|uniref:DUF421 domain-containing protein n=1 Tax=Paenibacillus sp. S150 TaxID=2749826 RepID=UPI001C563332|nr:DUF421 domain-containing protein [Paenibacillus sp. S150]MBW4082564.1 DUF421 domain-containing protein [Paenibacillus sp. S150]